VILYQRGNVQIADSLPYEQAIELAQLVHQAYNGELEPIQMNPYLKPEYKEKKLPSGKTVAQVFPL